MNFFKFILDFMDLCADVAADMVNVPGYRHVMMCTQAMWCTCVCIISASRLVVENPIRA